MREVLSIIVAVLFVVLVVLAFAFTMAFCLTVPAVHGFNKTYGTDYTTMQFFFNEETLRDYHGRTFILKE